MVGTLLGFGWRSWLAEYCFMVGGLMLGQRLSNEQTYVSVLAGVMTKMLPLYNFTITIHGRLAWKTSLEARASGGSRFWLVKSILFGDHVGLRLHW